MFVADLIRKAQKSVILIDKYIDESILLILAKKPKVVEVIIYASIVTKETKLDLKKYSSQYPDVKINQFNKSHDRLLIIDRKIVYHIGTLLNGIRKKWFAFQL